ncbi:hypothetical protein TNCV_4576121 [Trichonephila clavipes]|nr:hypothetical protein TNCV_4576121 [Trichonephila clavipes]
MIPNTLRVHKEYVLVKSVGPKVLWAVSVELTSAEGWRIFPSPPVPCLNCGGADRCVSPFILKNSNLSHRREFHRAKSYCHPYSAQGYDQRQAYL